MRWRKPMEEYDIISIPISDGTEREFAIINRFQARDKNYIAVSLVENEEIKDGIYIYRYEDAEDGDIIVETIVNEVEYKHAVKEYTKIQ